MLLVDTALAPDPTRNHRRWAEIESLTAGIDARAARAAEVLGGELATSR